MTQVPEIITGTNFLTVRDLQLNPFAAIHGGNCRTSTVHTVVEYRIGCR